MALLKKVTGDPAGQCIELKGNEVVIGRSPEANIVLDPYGVSRLHAKVVRDGNGYSLIDLRSRNKTKLNNEELVPERPYPLSPGDRINICDIEFVYYLSPPPPPERPGRDGVIVTDSAEDADSTIHTLDASRSDLMTSGVRPEVKLRAILEITRNLSSALEIDTVAPKVLDSLFELFPTCERGFLVLKDADSGKLVRKAFKFRVVRPRSRFATPAAPADEDEATMNISRSIVRHVLEQKKAVLSQDASHDPNLPVSASIADLKIRSVMCAPMLTPDGEALGILQLDTSDRKQFSQEDLDILAAVASQAAIAIQNAAMHEGLLEQERLSRDLRLAEQVQRRFLPQEAPKMPGYEFYAHYHAAYEVGGDYYDFVRIRDDRLAIALGDVSGKGVAAALMMAKFSGDTRYCILTEEAPGPAADALNELLYAAGIDERFITLSLSVLDLPARRLTLCSAGHPPVLVRRADGRVEAIGEATGGFPLGIVPTSSYDQEQVELAPGDVVVIYSDGVTDARGGPNAALYDSKDDPRLARRVAESRGGPEAVGRAILQAIREYSAGHKQADDITLVCFGPTG